MVFVPFSSSTSPQFSTPTLVSHFDVLLSTSSSGLLIDKKKKEKKTEMFSVFFLFLTCTLSHVFLLAALSCCCCDLSVLDSWNNSKHAYRRVTYDIKHDLIFKYRSWCVFSFVRRKKETALSTGLLISQNVLLHISDQCTEVECHLVKLVKVSLRAMGTS